MSAGLAVSAQPRAIPHLASRAAEAAMVADPAGSVPVQPVSKAYVGMHGMPMGREDRPFYAWYGDMELLPHLWEGLLAGPLDVVVEFHPPIAVDGGRKKIASVAEETIRDGLRRALSGVRPATADKTGEKQSEREGSAA